MKYTTAHTSPENKPNTERRKLLKMMAVAGGTLAAAGFVSPLKAVAATGRHNVLNVSTVAELDKLEALVDGDLVFVGGYYKAGDGGAKTLRWSASSTKAANGGTVHGYAGSSAGRFELVHDGRVDFRVFGIFDETTPADAAFDAFAADPSVSVIEAYSALNFQKRHTVTRSNLTLDFRGYDVYTDGIEPAADAENLEHCPLFLFTGEIEGTASSVTLTSPMDAYTDVYQVPSGFSGQVGDWYLIDSDTNPEMAAEGRTSAIELQRLAMVTMAVSGKYCFNHRPGYPLARGRSLTYRKVRPIENITVRNMKFHGKPGATGTDGVHPLAFLYAVNCNVFGLDGQYSFAALIFRRYNTTYITENCSLVVDKSIVSAGGRGYLTQQMFCNYGTVRNCRLAFGRHLNDFTCSSYMLVENCHSNYDYNGGFVTHGQYEHDLTYIGNSGLMSFANSKKPWAASAKNITVKRHTGCNLNAGDGYSVNRVSNLTVEDCAIFTDGVSDLGGNSRINGTIALNCDGLSVKNCSASNMLYLLGVSQNGTRPNCIEDSTFSLSYTESGTQQRPYFGSLDRSVRISQPVTFRGCTFTSASGKHFDFNAPVRFEHCTFEGDSSNILLATSAAAFVDCRFHKVGLTLEADGAVPAGTTFKGQAALTLTLRGCSFEGSLSSGAVTLGGADGLPALIELDSVVFQPDGSAAFVRNSVSADKLLGLKMRGCTVSGGTTDLAGGAGAYCIISDNYLSQHTFQNLPSSKVTNENVLDGTTLA